MCKKKITDILEETSLDLIGCACLDPVAIAKATAEVVKSPFFVQQRIFWKKFAKFAEGVRSDPDFEVKFATKIANLDTKAKKEEYAQKIFTIIDRIDEEKKIDFLINATRAYCWNGLSNDEYFRICLTISRCFYQDLLFVKNNYNKSFVSKGNTSVIELSNHGIMILVQSTMDELNETLIQPSDYKFTEFAQLLYEKSLNYEKNDNSEND